MPKISSGGASITKGKMTAAQLEQACLFDDVFMTACFKRDNAAVEHVLRAILEKPDLRVKDVVIQKPVKNLHGHSVRFDVYAEDSDGTLYVVEIQQVYASSGTRKKRRMDCADLLKRADFEYGLLVWHCVKTSPTANSVHVLLYIF